MSARLDRPATRDGLFLWIMHRFAEVFEEHAVIKGGMALRLLDCPRRTMDIDYVFVPFESKKEIVDRVSEVLEEIDGASVDMDLHSKMLRADLRVDGVAVQLEANVALRCETIPMTTGGFAHSVGQPSQIVRIMSPAAALSHKLAAWNERRLLRDLYDCYYLAARAGASPDQDVLDQRLSKIESRLPRLKGTRRMSREQFADALRDATGGLADADLEEELAGLLPADELAGLAIRIRAAVEGLADAVKSDQMR
jgi:predicted nucleotidyltransferase component of viral defense system